MKVIDVMTVIKKPLEQLSEAGVNVSDIRHIEMYDEYRRLMNEGHKKTNIIYHLAYDFKMGEKRVYEIIKLLEMEILPV